jgi:hypothetical protein
MGEERGSDLPITKSSYYKISAFPYGNEPINVRRFL